MRPSRLALPLCVALTAATSLAAERASQVVLVMVDDMGYADLGCQGAGDVRTPHIDRLAREGVRMTQFYAAAPVCSPSRCALMTGRWPQRAGIEWALGASAEAMRREGDAWRPVEDYKSLGLSTSHETLPRWLGNSGMATGHFGKWHLGRADRFGPNAHGFDEFFGIHGGEVDMYSHRYRDGQPGLYEDTAPIEREGYLTELITDRAVDFIERRNGDPFFLYVPYNAVHWPFQAPGHPEQTRTADTWYAGDRATYAAMLEAVDTGVGRLIGALNAAHVLDTTLFIFTNDNGGEVRLASNHPLFHHKATLWEGGVRVPCVLRWPGRLPAGVESSQVAVHMDLTATILAARGLAPPEDAPLDGVDLAPLLDGSRGPLERTLCWRIDRADRRQKAIRHGRWKLVLDGANPVLGHELLFDLEADEGERRNVGNLHPEIMADLRRRLAEWEADVDSAKPEIVVR